VHSSIHPLGLCGASLAYLPTSGYDCFIIDEGSVEVLDIHDDGNVERIAIRTVRGHTHTHPLLMLAFCDGWSLTA
jgi:hypothetical protein